MILARQGRRFNAKVAREPVSSGYRPAKKPYCQGVKIHLVGGRRPATLPAPRFKGVLAGGGLAVVLDPARRGLADVRESGPAQIGCADFALVTH